ncbi:hypothetical protein, partial [Lusitaniella coriacea]|uniref:hypothetical protein n=1 Tax=Lusitaniella coriacea TaxID=1983105 RepID=UPI001D14C968
TGGRGDGETQRIFMMCNLKDFVEPLTKAIQTDFIAVAITVRTSKVTVSQLHQLPQLPSPRVTVSSRLKKAPPASLHQCPNTPGYY